MRAAVWHGTKDVRVDQVPDPGILNPGDAIVRVSSTAICGSDLHLYNGFVPSMEQGDILGHEFMGEVVEIGPKVKRLKVGDRVVVPFPIACGHCFFCEQKLFSVCENSNPNAHLAEAMWGHTTGGIFGYSHLTGGYAGGQAEYVRVPYADVGPLVVPAGLADEQVLFLSDILPTGYMAAEACDITPGATVAVWGCGPVGQFAIQSAFLLGAERVIAIDHYPERLALARKLTRAETLNFDQIDVPDALRQMTGGRGPDACIDAVGMEAHGAGVAYAYDRIKQAMRLESDRPTALREAMMSCRNGGVVSVPGVYGGFSDKIPFGSVMNRSLTIRTGQCHVQRYMQPLLERVMAGEIDPAAIISHHMALEEAPHAYEIFKHKQEDCIKVVLHPQQLH
ncbi:MAG TPA: zinc-dependent alcohol dehydrogenase [Telluria sp.]|jgi:threonine dehydrogenase-like Zn-dependent dehydrogenase